MKFVNANGQPVNLAELALKHKPLKAAPTIEDATDAFGVRGKSSGFVVVGYSPEHWGQKDRDHAAAVELHKAGGKFPGTPEEFTAWWLRHNGPKRARSKPYELAASADVCAELLRKAGWLYVHVEEKKKG